MMYKILIGNFSVNWQLNKNKIPNKIFYKLLNPSGEIIAG